MNTLEGLHAIGYCRVSTDDKGQDPEIQAREIEKWAMSNGVILDAMFVEEASGGQWPRDELSKALVTIRTGKATILICYDQSRLTRDADMHMPFIRELMGNGKIIRYVVNGDQDPNSIGVKMINAIKNVTDSEERRVLREKTSLALRYRRDVLHIHVGRPAKVVITEDKSEFPTGKVTDKTIVLTPSQVLNFARQGWSPNYVSAHLLNVPPITFSRALKSAGLQDEYYNVLRETMEQKGVTTKG